MSDHENLIDTYLAAYTEPDESTRATLIAEVFATEATLADPPFSARGHDELSATFAAVQGHYPGHRFARTSAVDEHHETARYTWALDAPDGSTAVAGMDVVTFDTEGRIAGVTGFFGHLPPTA